jgi:hypothetical protein
MRSDELLSDPRAQVLTVPPGVNSKDYGGTGSWQGRGRRRGGKGGSRRGRGAGTPMMID